MKYLFGPDQINVSDYGSKSNALWQLANSGIPIASGLCLSIHHFNNQILKKLHSRFANKLYKLKDVKHAINLSSKIIDEFVDFKLKRDFIELLYLNLKKLSSHECQNLYVIRSSGIEEDSIKNSFAGVYESFNNVILEEIHTKLVQCWLSYWSPKAIIYRHYRTLPHLNGMGVLIQPQLRFNYSGVIFTKYPLKNIDDFYLEYTNGNPSDVVNGITNPSRAIIKKKSKKINFINQNHETISSEYISLLAQYCILIESFFRIPQDIEWGITNSGLFILQSRPITS